MPNVFDTPNIISMPNVFSTDPVVYQTPAQAAQLQAVQMGIPGMQWADALSKYGEGLKLEDQARALAEQKQAEEAARTAANAKILEQMGVSPDAAKADKGILGVALKQKVEEAKQKAEQAKQQKQLLATAKAIKISAKKRGYDLSDEEAITLAQGGMKPQALPSNKDEIASVIQGMSDFAKNIVQDSDRSKLAVELLKKSESAYKAVKGIDDLVGRIKKHPETVTIAGTASELASAIKSNAAALANFLGLGKNDVMAAVDAGINASNNPAAQSAQVRASILKLVRDFARSMGEYGRSLTDADVQAYTQQIAARWGNPDAVIAVLQDRKKDVLRDFNVEYNSFKDIGVPAPKTRYIQHLTSQWEQYNKPSQSNNKQQNITVSNW